MKDYLTATLTTVILLVILSITGFQSPVSASEVTPKVKDGYVVYYFHGNARCVTCMNIEELTKSSTEAKFSKELKNGSAEFVSVNVDESVNEHFINDYQLLTRCVVIAKMKDGKEVAYKRLDKVWSLNKDSEQFMEYFYKSADQLKGAK